MAEQINDGGPAFPGTCRDCGCECDGRQDGMPLRDWFAGQVLAGVMGSPGVLTAFADVGGSTKEVIAASCYEQADAMLQARTGGTA